jgi:hypothetical protein
MKNYLLSLLVTFICTYSFASFVAWDILTLGDWTGPGRGFYAVANLFIAALAEGIKTGK